MCHQEDNDRLGPLSIETETDYDTEFKELLELALHPKPGQLLNIWWYVDEILIGLPQPAGHIFEMLPELSGPLLEPFLEIFNIPSLDN